MIEEFLLSLLPCSADNDLNGEPYSALMDALALGADDEMSRSERVILLLSVSLALCGNNFSHVHMQVLDYLLNQSESIRIKY